MIKIFSFFMKSITSGCEIFLKILPFFRKKKCPFLKNHVIFRRIDEYVSYILPALQIPIRKIIFKDMLKMKFMVWKQTANKMIREFNGRTFETSEDFYLFVKAFFREANSTTKLQWLEMGVPIEAIQKFEMWHHKRVDSVSELIKNVSHSSIYSSYEEKLSVIFDCLSLGLSLTIIDAEKTIKDLNGMLDPLLKMYNECKGYDWK